MWARELISIDVIRTYFDAEGDVCTDTEAVPGNFSAFILAECVPTSENSSFITQCNGENIDFILHMICFALLTDSL